MAICVIVATRGSVPQPPGAMVCVDETANLTGTLGGGCVEADVRRIAHHSLTASKGQLASFELDDDFGYDDGMICGGTMDIAICPLETAQEIKPFQDALSRLEGNGATIPLRLQRDGSQVEYRVHIQPTPRLLIAGAGHISKILASMGVTAGFDVHVIDDRSSYVSSKRFPSPIETHVGDIAATLKKMPIDANTYVVIVTRGHNNDEASLSAVLKSPAGYLGMIGSKRKIEVIFEDLRHEGAYDKDLRRVHAPIGLPIGAVTAEEIAISIVAELVQVRRRSPTPVVQGPFPVESGAS